MTEPSLRDLKSALPRPAVLVGWLVLIGILIWSYAAVIDRLVTVWWPQPDYGHGYFVPIFALVLLLVRGRMVCGEPEEGDWWLHRLWSNKDWIPALLRSKNARIGVIIGAVLATPLYSFYLAGDTVSWWKILLAGGYGGALGGLIAVVAELFQHAGPGGQSSFSWTWWGMAFFALWALMRWASAYFSIERADEWSLLPCLAGLALFMGGWRALRWAWPSIVFLVFMIPLPGNVMGMDVQSMLRQPLQRIGTEVSVCAIQTVNIPALVAGEDSNVIQLPKRQLGVEEACSGLRMLMLFSAICVGAAFALSCPLWKKIVIVISAAPIAVFSNVVRITVTAILYHLADRVSGEWHVTLEEWAEWLFHDAAGLLMMPLALVLLWALWALMDRLFLEEVSEGPLVLGRSPARDSAAPDSPTDSQTTTNSHKQP